MSTTPQVSQSRRGVTLASGALAYEVTTTVVDRGDLPTKNLFVRRIVDPGDPKRDVLARVVEPYDLRRLSTALYVRVREDSLVYLDADPFARVASTDELTELPQDRADAVRRNLTTYLSSSVALTYPSLASADAAYKQLLGRLSQLVTDWRSFNAAFETRPTQLYTLPVSPQTVEDERRALYAAALAARKRVEADFDEANRAALDCEADCESDRTIHQMLLEDVTFLEAARARVLTIGETITGGSGGTPSHNAQDFCVQAGSYSTDALSYEALLSAKRAKLADYTARVRACETRCVQLGRARDAAQVVLSRAQDAERRAVAGVRDVCPTFTPTE